MGRTGRSITRTVPSLSPPAQIAVSLTKVITTCMSLQLELVMIVLAKMYNRKDAPQDPHVCIQDMFGDKERQMMYSEESTYYDIKLLNAEGGMDVFIRKN